MVDSEKRGRTTRPRWLIKGFRHAVLGFGLFDVPVEGSAFTWFKSLSTAHAVEERLDRALANNAWFNLFSNALLENLVAPASDHYSILLHRCHAPRAPIQNRKLRYENVWQMELRFKTMVAYSWHMPLTPSIIPKLTICTKDISARRKHHGNKLKFDI